MSDMPYDKLYAVRHGQTGKMWAMGAIWHWSSLKALQDCWELAQEVELVKGNLRDHEIVEIHLTEHV